MEAPRVIAITGAAQFWGGWLSRRLSSAGHHILAIDIRRPDALPDGVEPIEVDLSNPLLTEVFQAHGVQQVLHTDFRWERRPTEAGFEHNVVGATRLLTAATNAGVRQVVLMSHTLAYGARPDHPAFISENTRPRATDTGYARHLTEIEDVVYRLRGQPDAPALTVLRFAHIVGPQSPSLMNELLKLWATPTLLGFDPLIQLVHEEDVAAAMEHALLGWADEPYNGAVNIGAHPPIPLAKLLRAAGVQPIPVLHPLAYLSGRVSGVGPLEQAQPLGWDTLRYPVVGDLRRMTTEFGFTPTYDTDAILAPLMERARLRGLSIGLQRGPGQGDSRASEETPNG
ncbi:MAG: NAD-dependent epimerase/dehydratase family protein [Anaerolineae bacterium]|nr:NAD-dependent epimerase/dehydratase family protein [Anaerolineae bacterium]